MVMQESGSSPEMKSEKLLCVCVYLCGAWTHVRVGGVCNRPIAPLPINVISHRSRVVVMYMAWYIHQDLQKHVRAHGGVR